MGTLQSFILHRRSQGVKTRTINFGLQVVRHILNLAESEWIDLNGVTWLQRAPRIKFLPETDRRKPRPLSFEEQATLFAALPPYLARMATFKVNTGCREQEVCQLRWKWERVIPELATSVFLIPSEHVKNREDRLVVLNSIARMMVDSVRGEHEDFVFTYRGKPVKKMNGRAWQAARKRVNMRDVRVHDLKHTFGRRLRAAGVSFEDRQDLLGHKSGRVTTHYSSPELSNLIAAANRVCPGEWGKNGEAIILEEKNRYLVAV